MAIIYLVRHGQASANSVNYDCLSPLGEQQANLVGEALLSKLALPNTPPVVPFVVKGAMLRHQQTARYLVDGLSSQQNQHVEPVTDARWNEYDHQNILAGLDQRLATPNGMKQYFVEEGLTRYDFRQVFMSAMQCWLTASPNVSSTTGIDTNSFKYTESWYEFESRIQGAFDDLVNQVVKEHIDVSVVFTSGGPISLVSARLLGLPDNEFMKVNWNLVNGGITKILVNPKNRDISLSVLNEHDVLETQSRKMVTYT